LGVEHQIVERGDNKAKAEESVRSNPGKEERAEGEEEAEEKQEGGCQRNRIHCQTDVMEQLCCENRHPWAKVMTSETEDRKKRDGHCC